MTTLTYRDAVGKAIQDSLRDDSRLILIGQNIAGYSLKPMAEEFGESRIRDTSISESAMVGMAVGAGGGGGGDGEGRGRGPDHVGEHVPRVRQQRQAVGG